MRVVIGEGSCGIASGAKKVRQALESSGISNIGVTGCIGMCFLEPIVDILDDEGSLIKRLVKVSQNDAPRIAQALGANDLSIVEDLWIRPEDVSTYEPYIDLIEFIGDITQEQALYRIYIEQKAWPGEVSDIITNLNYKGTNRLIPPHTFGIKRAVCGQRCQETGRCKICYRTLDLANPTLLSDYRDAMNLS
jgi:(2Fe-2S) ferredoxin